MPFLIRLLSAPNGLLVNRYGYSPIALEWDLWLDPASPAELAGANVDHGSPLHLVQQVSSRQGCVFYFPVHHLHCSRLVCPLSLAVGHRHDPEV